MNGIDLGKTVERIDNAVKLLQQAVDALHKDDDCTFTKIVKGLGEIIPVIVKAL